MKIRFKKSIASATWSGRRGSVVEVPDAEARGLIAGGAAEAVEEARPKPTPAEPTRPAPAESRAGAVPTAATVESPEQAITPKARGRVGG